MVRVGFGVPPLGGVGGPICCAVSPVWECAGLTALWNWETCLPVEKRRRVAALQTQNPLDFAAGVAESPRAHP
jgi:hypothetical protein